MKYLMTSSLLALLSVSASAHVSPEHHVHTEGGQFLDMVVNFIYSPSGAMSLVIAAVVIVALVKRNAKH